MSKIDFTPKFTLELSDEDLLIILKALKKSKESKSRALVNNIESSRQKSIEKYLKAISLSATPVELLRET